MHEASIAEYILSIIDKRVEIEGPEFECSSVTVQIGEFRNVDPDSLKFAFDSIKDSLPTCKNCQLQTIYIEAEAVCISAHSFRPTSENQFSCPVCGAGVKQFKAGEELDIIKIVINTAKTGSLKCTK